MTFIRIGLSLLHLKRLLIVERAFGIIIKACFGAFQG